MFRPKKHPHATTYIGSLSDADSSLHSLPDGATCSSPKQYQQVKANNLTVIVVNTQSSMAKKECLWQIIDDQRPDVILASETWLKSDIHDTEIIPADFGYELFRNDRSDGYGGVLIAVKRTLIYTRIISFRQPCPLNRCLVTGSLVCRRDRDHQRRNRNQHHRAYSQSAEDIGDKDKSRLLATLVATGLGVSIATFLITRKLDTASSSEEKSAKDGTAVSAKKAKKVAPKPKPPPPFPEYCPYLLIGAGLASLSAFKAIKTYDPQAKVLMIGEEKFPPYNRPPLSKELWYEEDQENVRDLTYMSPRGRKIRVFLSEGLYMEPGDVAENVNGGLSHMSEAKVVSINHKKKKVVLDNGKEIQYGKLLIATGGRPKNLEIFENADGDVKRKTTVFRNLNDLMDLYILTESAKSIAVIGAGFLGSELATAMVVKDKVHGNGDLKVYQVFPQQAHYPKILSPALGLWVTERVKAGGVNVFPQNDVKSATCEDGKVKLELSGGETLLVDHVVVAVGLEPSTDLAQSAGLKLDPLTGGIHTDAGMKVCDGIWAAGDVASFEDPILGRRRVEHYDNASVTGGLAGKNMAGVPGTYDYQSMFWAELGKNVSINAVGLVDAKMEHKMFCEYEQTENELACKAVVLYRKNSRVCGVLTFNLFDDVHMNLAREVIKDGCLGRDLFKVASLFLNTGDLFQKEEILPNLDEDLTKDEQTDESLQQDESLQKDESVQKDN